METRPDTHDDSSSASVSVGSPTIAPVVLRPMIHEDIGGGLRLCRASGWNQVAHDWEHFLTVNPHGAQVLEKQGLVVGTVTSLRYGRFGWLAMVLVDPAERGRGLGSRLLSTGLRLLEDLPSTRLDATPAGEGLYRTHGFHEEQRLSRMALGGSHDHPSLVPSGVRPMSLEDLARIGEWDGEVFGGDRRHVLEWLYHGAPDYAWVAESSGRLSYVLGRHGFAYHHLGPVIAEDASVALQLVGACVSHAARPFIVDASRHAPEWIRGLEDLGFEEQRPFVRMALGSERFGLPAYQFASAGPELG